ncbi:DUF3662 domain-containing protein [Eggerthellaceae bacterium zg-887]|uniref:FhaA domain-containing protein n=1 Tax=Xiamenia xianingshaonis TaxID=2682776 RepID=UPI001407578C|nr:FHA domain-containing protein [Xiamenia xianingshaonis]NHM15729.1 DUF3662 domain-containing protein [Xiamenia xianingshaonis]
MGFLSRFEGKMEDTFEGAADKVFDSPISPVQIAKKAEKQMKREKMVGAGKQYAPTLYTVLVNPDDDKRLFGYYPTLAGETETYLVAKAAEHGLVMDGQPLVRFIVDDGLKSGKFDIIAEAVAAPIVMQLRNEEMQRYGLVPQAPYGQAAPYGGPQPYVPDPYTPSQPTPADAYEPYDPYQPVVPAVAPVAGIGAAGAASAVPARGNHTIMIPPAGAAPAPADAGGPQAQLIDVATNRPFALSGARITMGRESVNDIQVHDINASRKHAELTLQPNGAWTITDVGSTNGTIVNGRPVASQVLRPGDHITIGTTEYTFVVA